MPSSAPAECGHPERSCEVYPALSRIQSTLNRVEEQGNRTHDAQGRLAAQLLEHDHKIKLLREDVDEARRSAGESHTANAETLMLMKALSEKMNLQLREYGTLFAQQSGVLQNQTDLLNKHSDMLRDQTDTQRAHTKSLSELATTDAARSAREKALADMSKTTADWIRWGASTAIVLLLAVIAGITWVITHVPSTH